MTHWPQVQYQVLRVPYRRSTVPGMWTCTVPTTTMCLLDLYVTATWYRVACYWSCCTVVLFTRYIRRIRTMGDSSSASGAALNRHHHAIYRRQVCQYLSPINDPILKEMERTLGRHALQRDQAFVLTKNASTLLLSKQQQQQQQQQELLDDEIRFDMRVPPTLVHCHHCGVFLKGRIRIQTVNRGDTRRRRASRRLAARKREQQRVSSTRPSTGMTMMMGRTLGEDAERTTKELNRLLFQVTDGTSKNVVVQTCNHCAAQRKMKGMPITKKTRKPKPVVKQAEATNLENDRQSNAIKKPMETGAFQSPLLASSKAKKKKKKKQEPQSGLMNFLSSLNS